MQVLQHCCQHWLVCKQGGKPDNHELQSPSCPTWKTVGSASLTAAGKSESGMPDSGYIRGKLQVASLLLIYDWTVARYLNSSIHLLSILLEVSTQKAR